MDSLYEFEVRVEGTDIGPGTLDAEEGIELLRGFLRALLAVAEESGPRPKVVFTEITSGSLAYVLASREAAVRDDIHTLARRLRDPRDVRLPRVARDWVDDARRFAEKQPATVHLAAERKGAPILTIPDDIGIAGLCSVRGKTTIYGEVQRVGGATAPKVALRLGDGRLLSCETKRELAQQLGGCLYRRVGVRGTAEWNPQTWRLVEFTVEEVLGFEPSSVGDAFRALAQSAGPDVWGADPEQSLSDWQRDDQ